jgi:1-acyl-sn-glycerol-3-phosphate acyltransferase
MIINNIRYFIGSSIYNIYIVLVLIIYGTIGSPLIILKSKKIFIFSKYWADAMLFGAKIFCGITYKIENKENFPKKPCIIASKHQSAYECLVFLSLFPGICFILKKELLKIPIFGSYLKALNMISINRKNAKESISTINKEAKKRIEDERFVLIFPEGTRMNYDEKSDCKSGIVFLHKQKISKIVPVWVNSGLFWSKNSFFKKNGVISIRFLDEIEDSFDSRELINHLNNKFDSQY